MKKYKQLVKELPSKKVVFAFGRFQPPTNGHELLVNAVAKVAKAQGADHVIYASRTQDKKSNPLPVDRKVYYLKRMFRGVNFVAANDQVRTFIEAATALSKKYKHLVMIAGSDRVPEYKKLLDTYNGKDFTFETIEVISAGERDPDSDTASGMSGTKMREAAKKGNYTIFKKGLPRTLTDLDGKRLMNEIREGMSLDPIKESITFERDALREKYHAGKIFNVGDRVKDQEGVYEIVDRGANYISVVNESGNIIKKWLNSVKPAKNIKEDAPLSDTEIPNEITYKGYTTKNFSNTKDAAIAFIMTIKRAQDPVAILNALKATDTYMGLNDRHIAGEELTSQEIEQWREAHQKAREYLQNIGEFQHHLDYWHTHEHEFQDLNANYPEAAEKAEVSESLQGLNMSNPADKIKAARVIATSLGLADVDKMGNPDVMVNSALRKIKNKNFSPASLQIIKNMIDFAKTVGIKVDEKLVPAALSKMQTKEGLVGATLHDDPTVRKMKIKHHLGEEEEKNEKEDDEDEDIDDDEIEKMIDGMDDDEFLHAYDDDELAIIDDETGEHVEDIKDKDVKEEALNEVLSRVERLKSKIRFARTQSKRERRLKIALRTRSSTSKINQRARRMAVKALKVRLAKKPLNKLSVGEKERLERIVQARKKAISRIAMRMVPKVRRIENDRLVHSNYTK